MITKIRSLSRFVTQKPNASLLLFLTTIAAVVLANSPLVDAYNSCLEYPLDFRFDNFIFFPHHGQPMSLTTFVNDAFMAIFFFVVGMEIKQELLVGELSSARKALLPVIAACGGMIVPVLVYLSVCHSGPAAHGAAIPMATDIAFALAALGALGSRVPLSLRVFLTALAVVDDIGGIIVIAIFYSGHVAATPLLIALGVLVFLTVGGRLGIQHALFFYTGFFVVWYLFTQAGIHPTIAGVLVAFTVPARPKVKLDSFADNMRDHLASLDFTQARHAGKSTVLSPGQVLVLTNIHRLAAHTVSPLQSLVESCPSLPLSMPAYTSAASTFRPWQASRWPSSSAYSWVRPSASSPSPIWRLKRASCRSRRRSRSGPSSAFRSWAASGSPCRSSSPTSPLLPCPTSATNCSTKPSWASLSGRSSRASSAISS